MLESEYDLNEYGLLLAVVHPDLSAPRLIAAPRLDAEISALPDFECAQGRAVKCARYLDDPFVL